MIFIALRHCAMSAGGETFPPKFEERSARGGRGGDAGSLAATIVEVFAKFDRP
jgi:hypothetical protein